MGYCYIENSFLFTVSHKLSIPFMGYDTTFASGRWGFDLGLSIPFMGYKAKIVFDKDNELNFQFPLWDTKLRNITLLSAFGIILSIPFMGYFTVFVKYIINPESNFQFPLWDTWNLRKNTLVFLRKTFNSLYGIRFMKV